MLIAAISRLQPLCCKTNWACLPRNWEFVAFPSCSKILARHLPEYHRGFANGVIASAFRCGNAVGTFGAGIVMARYGWRPVFIGIGLISLLWLPAWIRWMPRGRV